MVHAEDAHAYSQEKLNPHELVRDVCSELEVMAHAKNQRILVYTDTPDCQIFANKLKIEELVSNLVSNAIKYSPPKTKITVTSLCDGGEFRFAVEDEGPGFSEEDRAKAFQYGVTLNAKPTKGESSSGFGLFISKQIVTSHKGHIEIGRPASGGGARVSFGLPLD
jgi:signal transduction histidine kinase